MTTPVTIQPCAVRQTRHCNDDSCGVDHYGSRLPTRLTIAVDAHAGYLDEVALSIFQAVLLELGNWELIAKGIHFSIEYPPASTRSGPIA